MVDQRRRNLLKLTATIAGSAALGGFPPSIRRALSLPATQITGTIRDVEHVVILMQENRSFDHYFGSLRGVRGFGDRHPIPLAGGKSVWHQSDGVQEIMPFHFDTKITSALCTPGTPHTFDNAQAAWAQGQLNCWPKFKTKMSMGHFRRGDIPFQFALAEAFTLCDAYHCSVTTGTDPNRIVFLSGSNFDPQYRMRAENCTAADAEVNNLRCWIEGTHPEPGYRYKGSSFHWLTLPELLERAGVSWRIYQNPNDNWTGLMHGGLAFAAFRNASKGDPIYEKGMTEAWVDQFHADIRQGKLPQVSWVLPSQVWSEHPSGSSALQGSEFISSVLDALTANADVWGKTVVFLTFDENDGLFDHVPPPAPPSYMLDGSLAGKSTIDLRGEYFSDPERKYLHPDDHVSGTVRPWGLGPRVPMYVISPWSRGGWVNSQVFDHTSVGRFLEKRFGINVPAISPWHRAVCGDLSSAFDFVSANETPFPELPDVRDASVKIADNGRLSKPAAPDTPEPLFQEAGMRRSRALPYEIHVDGSVIPDTRDLVLKFRNTGRAGAVLHVYDRLHLERIPRRYTVEAGKELADAWPPQTVDARYDLWVHGPNGFVREFRGTFTADTASHPDVELKYDPSNVAIAVIASNVGKSRATLELRSNAYRVHDSLRLEVGPGQHSVQKWSVVASHGWYDLTVSGPQFERRFAGRMETGSDSFTDPAV